MEPIFQGQDVKNVWFAGVHSDVGGGYPPTESGLAKITFEWMTREAIQCGLDIDQASYLRELHEDASPDANGPLHVSLKGGWWVGEILPMRRFSWDDKKWHWHWIKGGFNQSRRVLRSADKPFVALHHSVLDRLKQSANYRPPNIPHDEPLLRSTFQVEN